MKTITMDYEEHEAMKLEVKMAKNGLADYRRAIKLVYGEEVAESILQRADQIEDSQNHTKLQRMAFDGKL